LVKLKGRISSTSFGVLFATIQLRFFPSTPARRKAKDRVNFFSAANSLGIDAFLEYRPRV
jgi:hypothetical protein